MTNDNGDFEILDLPRDSYRLTATKPGFKTFVAENLLEAVREIIRTED